MSSRQAGIPVEDAGAAALTAVDGPPPASAVGIDPELKDASVGANLDDLGVRNTRVQDTGLHDSAVHGTGVRLRIRATAQNGEGHRDHSERTREHWCPEPSLRGTC
jgi:hypothetical protein